MPREGCGWCTIPYVARYCRPTCTPPEAAAATPALRVPVAARVFEAAVVTDETGTRPATQADVAEALFILGIKVCSRCRSRLTDGRCPRGHPLEIAS